jgi:glycosyltransferase involved in cell wall biosynthesis
MNLIAASRVLNESDLIESFVRHTAHFVDHHLFVDNGSVDGTLQILESLRQEGFAISVFRSDARTFIEEKINTFLYETAVGGFAADWVVFLDVDEFIDDRRLQQRLRDRVFSFGMQHGAHTCMAVPLREYHVTAQDSDDLVVASRIRHCSPTSDNLKVIVPADLVRRQARVQAGNHSVLIDGGTVCPAVREPSLTYAHYAVRSPYQWLSKSIIGWAKILAAGPEKISAGYSYHYKNPFELLRTNPRSILRDPVLMTMPATPAGHVADPIVYRGGPLRYTGPTDYPMRAVQVIMQYLHDLALHHGEVMELANNLGGLIGRSESGVSKIG